MSDLQLLAVVLLAAAVVRGLQAWALVKLQNRVEELEFTEKEEE